MKKIIYIVMTVFSFIIIWALNFDFDAAFEEDKKELEERRKVLEVKKKELETKRLTTKKKPTFNSDLPSIKIVSESKYSDTEQIWIAVYELKPEKWTPEGYNVFKDGKFEFVLKFDEAFASLRSMNEKYIFEPNPEMGIGKMLKECIIKNGWFDTDANKSLCDCSKIYF